MSRETDMYSSAFTHNLQCIGNRLIGPIVEPMAIAGQEHERSKITRGISIGYLWNFFSRVGVSCACMNIFIAQEEKAKKLNSRLNAAISNGQQMLYVFEAWQESSRLHFQECIAWVHSLFFNQNAAFYQHRAVLQGCIITFTSTVLWLDWFNRRFHCSGQSL